jgi:PAS domain S-box-containing protein
VIDLDNRDYASQPPDKLIKEIIELKSRLEESEETLNAIRTGEIDAIVVEDPEGPQIYTMEGADYLYRILVEEMCEGVATLTSDGTIFYSNNKLASLIKMPLEQITGQRLNDFIPPDDLKTFQTMLNKGLKGNSKAEINIESVDGSITPVLISIKALERLKGVYAIITDLSPQKSHENLIKTQEQLTKTLKDLKRSNAELEQFAYVASHDLQEPLRMVSSFTQMLEMKYKDELDDEALEYIKFAVGGAKRMHLLINDLLAYSRVTSKDSEFKGIDLKRVMDEVIFNLEIDIEENQAVITQEPLPEIVGDYSQMVRVFQNLIGNAIKYRREEKPRIHVRTRKEPDHWLFSVEDNGIGIEPEYFGQVFQIFRRLHTQDEYGGTGIGLAITKRIIERHRGKIWLESEPEKGSTFYFTLPEIKS